MSWRIKFLFFVMLFFAAIPVYSFFDNWKTEESEHFVVKYHPEVDADWAANALRKAEESYDKIAYQVGYSRYVNFWTWDNRVQILVFPDQSRFSAETGQPPWAKGFAVRESDVLESKTIVTYQQESEFLDGLLPHEVCHLIVKDYLGDKATIPLWFDEGIAQLQEAGKPEKAELMMRQLVAQGIHIPVVDLINHDIRKEKDANRVILFYAESINILDFLIKKYGSEDFQDLCRLFKEGKSFEEALPSAYNGNILSVGDLQEKWLSYMKN